VQQRIGGGSESLTPLSNYFFVAHRLVAATLLARDRAAVVPFNRGSHHAAALSWADGDTIRADANCGVGVVPPATVLIVAVVAVPPDLNIDALSHPDALGLGIAAPNDLRPRFKRRIFLTPTEAALLA
jgi:hypothetical protein